MPELVIELLERVDIDHEQAEGVAEARRPADLLPEAHVEVAPVPHLGQLVRVRHLAETEVRRPQVLGDRFEACRAVLEVGHLLAEGGADPAEDVHANDVEAHELEQAEREHQEEEADRPLWVEGGGDHAGAHDGEAEVRQEQEGQEAGDGEPEDQLRPDAPSRKHGVARANQGGDEARRALTQGTTPGAPAPRGR